MPIIAGIDVRNEGMPQWEQGGKTYHLNVTTTTYHVTEEGRPKIQYFFEADLNRDNEWELTSTRPTPAERGRNSKMFNRLPVAVQNFVNDNYGALIGL